MTITAQLASLLRRVGCRNVQVRAYAIDWSFGTAAHEAMCKNMQVGMKLVEQFYLAAGIATWEALDKTYEQMLNEMQQKTFSATHYLLCACGEKPA